MFVEQRDSKRPLAAIRTRVQTEVADRFAGVDQRDEAIRGGIQHRDDRDRRGHMPALAHRP